MNYLEGLLIFYLNYVLLYGRCELCALRFVTILDFYGE